MSADCCPRPTADAFECAATGMADLIGEFYGRLWCRCACHPSMAGVPITWDDARRISEDGP